MSRATDNLDSVQVTVCNCRYIFPSAVDITRNFKASTWSTQGFQGDRIYLPEMEKKKLYLARILEEMDSMRSGSSA